MAPLFRSVAECKLCGEVFEAAYAARQALDYAARARLLLKGSCRCMDPVLVLRCSASCISSLWTMTP